MISVTVTRYRPCILALVVIAASFVQAVVCAQSTNSNYVNSQIMPSPEVASLGRFIETPVSLSTGVATASIPIHTLTQGPLTVPINLRYHSQGVKAAETASRVGIGWALEASGFVSRAVAGIPDESDEGFYFTNDQIDLTSSLDPSEWVSRSIVNNLIDGQPDIFSFSFPGYSGKFYIDANHDIILVPNQDLKISFNGSNELDSGTEEDRFERFEIVTPDGNIYQFGSTSSGTESYVEISEPLTGTTTYQKFPTAWKLTSLSTPDRKNTICFNYEKEKFIYASPGQSAYNRYYHFPDNGSSGSSLSL